MIGDTDTRKIRLAIKSATSINDLNVIKKFKCFLQSEGRGPTMGEMQELPIRCREYLLDTNWSSLSGGGR